MKKTIKQLWKIAKTNNQPLLGLSTDLSTLDFMEDYLAKNEAFDRDIARNKGFFSYTEDQDEDDTDLEYFQQWQKDVYYFLLKNEENYKRLFALLSVTYDPISNYDKHSTIVDTESGTDTDTNIIGARHREEDYAQRQNTNAYGAVSESDTIGQKQNTNAYGATSETTSHGAQSETYNNGQKQNTNAYGATSETTTHGTKTTTTTEKIAGFDSATFENANEGSTQEGQQQDTVAAIAHTDTITEGAQSNSKNTTAYTDGVSAVAHTDTLTEGQQLNSHTEQAKTDTITEGAHKDKFDENQAIDTLQKAYGHKNTHTEETSGNIGVMSTQNMLGQETDFWKSFKFYDILFNDIVKELCHYYDEGYDCF